MTNKEFIELLNKSSPSLEEKLVVLQFYIDNFPIYINRKQQVGPMLIDTGEKIFTKLVGINIVDGNTPESEKLTIYSFDKLYENRVKLEEFLNKLEI